MIQLERTAVMNLENVMRGARNPMNSWARSDSYYNEEQEYILGPNDLDLARRLCLAGSDHRKFIRQILVSVDITAPLYWWKEYDTYKADGGKLRADEGVCSLFRNRAPALCGNKGQGVVV